MWISQKAKWQMAILQRKRMSKSDRSSLALMGNSYRNKHQITYTINLCSQHSLTLYAIISCAKGRSILVDCIFRWYLLGFFFIYAFCFLIQGYFCIVTFKSDTMVHASRRKSVFQWGGYVNFLILQTIFF